MIHPPIHRVRLAPLAGLRARLSIPVIRADALAGLTVAVFAVPQAMAYAALAGLPPAHGLYAAVAMSIVAALWGSSPFVNTGPTNTAALLTAATLAPFVSQGAAQGGAAPLLELVFTFTLLVGLIRMAMGLLRLGWLVRLVPEPAFLGFMVAADILIALGQLHQFLGVPAPQAASTLGRLFETLARAPTLDWRPALIGLGVVAAMWAGQSRAARYPVGLAAIILATVAAHWLGHGSPIALVRNIAPIPAGLPSLRFGPIHWDLLGAMLPGALAVAAIGLIEAVSIAQSLALKKKLEVNYNQEFFGQGASQIAGAFLGGFPGSGSFSRSALIEKSGGQTGLANVFFGVFTALSLWLFPGWLEQIPLAALAGLLFYTGFKLLDFGAVRRVWLTSRADFAVLAITFAVTFFGKIEWGFFAGVVAAMALFLNRARDLQIFELVPCVDSLPCVAAPSQTPRFAELPYKPGSAHERSDVVALALHGDLFFAMAHELREQLAEIARLQNPSFIVVRTRRAHSVDYACWKALFDFAETFRQQGGVLILTGVRDELMSVIRNAGMVDVLPPACIVAPSDSAWRAFSEGLERVSQQLPPDPDLSPAWAEYFAGLPAPREPKEPRA